MASAQEIAGRVRSRARKLARELGYEVHRLGDEPPAPPPSPAPTRDPMPTIGDAVRQLIRQTDPRTVLDVGANVGQFAGLMRKLGFTGQIISFEPLPDEHRGLVAKAEADPNWIVAPRGALGASEGTARLNVAGNSQSSSLLGMMDLVTDIAPDAGYIDAVETPVRRLDDVLDELGVDPSESMLKIDAQGFEAEVLRGATATLPSVVAAHVELSFDLLYEGQPRTSEVFDLLARAGLELSNVNDGFNALDGRILQIDGSFIRLDRQK